MQCCNIWWNYINCETILQQLLEHLQTSVVSTVFASYLCQTVMQNSNACAAEQQETYNYKYKLFVQTDWIFHLLYSVKAIPCSTWHWWILGSGPIPFSDLLVELCDCSKLSTNHPLPSEGCKQVTDNKQKNKYFWFLLHFQIQWCWKKMCRGVHILCRLFYIWIYNFEICLVVLHTQIWRVYEWKYPMASLGIQCFAKPDSNTAPLWKSIPLKRLLITL